MGKKVEQPAQHLVRFNLNIFADIRLICETTRPNERNLVVVFDKDDKLPKSPASRREASQRRASPDEAETQPVHRKQGVVCSSPAAVSTQRESGDGKRNGKKSARTSSKGRGGVLCDITKEFEIADTDIPCQDQPSPTKAPPARAESQPVRRKQGVGSSSTAAVSTQRDSGDGKRNGKKPARTSSEGRGGVLCDITKEFEITETDTPCQDQPSPTKASPAREPLAEVLQYNDGEEEKTETPSLTESNVNDDQTFQTQPVAAKRTLLADQSSSQNDLGCVNYFSLLYF
ncbi:uncharacterized protein LOC135948299 [Cloeon dipterum]|uniref:uncharacterized protein LOC135948299 n=1 Tax=Cloeon dipterum TaxID=197152 RepID=UPI0032208E2A